MWILQSATPPHDSFTFRLTPGAIKTVGRAPRADFIVDTSVGYEGARAQVRDILARVANMPKRVK